MAQIIDALLLGAPIIAGFIFMLARFWVMEEMFFGPSYMLVAFGLVLGGIGWALAAIIVYSATEGAWGVTPGKWVLGIRVVGTDMHPCGFGRALVRNLLKFVDGFFQFMVGVLLVALTENWQRLGDLAARTIVVCRRPATPRANDDLPHNF